MEAARLVRRELLIGAVARFSEIAQHAVQFRALVMSKMSAECSPRLWRELVAGCSAIEGRDRRDSAAFWNARRSQATRRNSWRRR